MHPLLLSGLLVLPNAALPRLDLNRIQPADAARAIAAAHPEFADATVELPGGAASREPNPELTAGPVERWAAGSPGTAHIRLRCAADSICRPFYATVHLHEPDGGEMKLPAAPGLQPESTPSLRPGAHAALLIDSGRIHLRIPVTCLSGGAPGAPIRVAGPKNSRVYQATVVDGATVRGAL